MSKVEAYIADCCGKLVHEDAAIGIKNIEDLHDIQLSYPSISDPSKAYIHYCLICYRDKVLNAAQRMVNRKKDEEAYKLKLKELSFSLRNQAVMNWRKNKRKTLENPD